MGVNRGIISILSIIFTFAFMGGMAPAIAGTEAHCEDIPERTGANRMRYIRCTNEDECRGLTGPSLESCLNAPCNYRLFLSTCEDAVSGLQSLVASGQHTSKPNAVGDCQKKCQRAPAEYAGCESGTMTDTNAKLSEMKNQCAAAVGDTKKDDPKTNDPFLPLNPPPQTANAGGTTGGTSSGGMGDSPPSVGSQLNVPNFATGANSQVTSFDSEITSSSATNFNPTVGFNGRLDGANYSGQNGDGTQVASADTGGSTSGGSSIGGSSGGSGTSGGLASPYAGAKSPATRYLNNGRAPKFPNGPVQYAQGGPKNMPRARAALQMAAVKPRNTRKGAVDPCNGDMNCILGGRGLASRRRKLPAHVSYGTHDIFSQAVHFYNHNIELDHNFDIRYIKGE